MFNGFCVDNTIYQRFRPNSARPAYSGRSAPSVRGSWERVRLLISEATLDGALAYFITFTCYGTWLHGDDRGSVDLTHNRYGDPVLPADADRFASQRAALRDPPYRLDEPRRAIVVRAIREVALEQRWDLLAVHARSNHVHVVVRAGEMIERVLSAFKAAATRCLNKAYPQERSRKHWTRHGSTRYLMTDEQVAEKVTYTLDEQGEPMQRYPDAPRATETGAAHGGSGATGVSGLTSAPCRIRLLRSLRSLRGGSYNNLMHIRISERPQPRAAWSRFFDDDIGPAGRVVAELPALSETSELALAFNPQRDEPTDIQVHVGNVLVASTRAADRPEFLITSARATMRNSSASGTCCVTGSGRLNSPSMPATAPTGGACCTFKACSLPRASSRRRYTPPSAPTSRPTRRRYCWTCTARPISASKRNCKLAKRPRWPCCGACARPWTR